MLQHFKLLRPLQWSKNVFVFLPLFFDRKLTDMGVLWLTVIAAVAFSLAASAVYCLNDVLDREADAKHPVKCKRPVASGAVTVPTAIAMMVACAAVAMALAWWLLPWQAAAIIAAYMVVNVLYSTWLKHLSLVDVMVVAVFYVMRVMAGAAAGGIEPSSWIIIMTFLLALFLVLAKRRDDAMLRAAGQKEARRGTDLYNVEFLNLSLTLIATVTIVAYIMYTISPEVMENFGNRYIYLTTVWVLAGIMRYMQLTIVEGRTGSATRVLFKDRFVQVCLLGWVVSFLFIIYG